MPSISLRFDGDKLLARVCRALKDVAGVLFGRPQPLQSQLEQIRNAYKRKGGLNSRIIAERLGIAIGDELGRLRRLEPDDFNTIIERLATAVERSFDDIVCFYDFALLRAANVRRMVLISDPIVEAKPQSVMPRKNLYAILSYADEVCLVSPSLADLQRIAKYITDENSALARKLSLWMHPIAQVGVSLLVEQRDGSLRGFTSDQPPRFLGASDDTHIFAPQSGWLSEVAPAFLQTEKARIDQLLAAAQRIGLSP